MTTSETEEQESGSGLFEILEQTSEKIFNSHPLAKPSTIQACVAHTFPDWIDGMASYNLVSNLRLEPLQHPKTTASKPSASKRERRNQRFKLPSTVKQGFSRNEAGRFTFYCRHCSYQSAALRDSIAKHIGKCKQKRAVCNTSHQDDSYDMDNEKLAATITDDETSSSIPQSEVAAMDCDEESHQFCERQPYDSWYYLLKLEE